MSFPKNFSWGVAAASHQIEGGAYDDGKGLSVWDMMSRWPGRTWNGNTGDVSCDHYHLFQNDAKLMGELGLNAYRLSISWPRVMPTGTDVVNEKGLAFYDKLVDALLGNNVEPWITLFHWDYPYELYCRGGWLNRDSSDWFADYTSVVVDKLSDRVSHWMTQNEPQCYLGLGHQVGEHAPGLKLDFPDILLATHHSLLAHGKAVQVVRTRAKLPPIIGAAPVGYTYFPVSESKTDVDAARSVMFSITEKNCWNNTWFADPMIFGKYPEDGLELFQTELPTITDNDMATICQPLDFYGVNIYHGQAVEALSNGSAKILPLPLGPPLTTMIWHVTPKALYWGPRFFHERYKLPIVVTENGMANCDWVHLDGRVHDPQRIDFLARYLKEYKRAIDDGVDARGYFLWTVMDNFEWAFGYRQRFGIVYVDFETKERIPKDSAHWYSEIIQSNGGLLE